MVRLRAARLTWEAAGLVSRVAVRAHVAVTWHLDRLHDASMAAFCVLGAQRLTDRIRVIGGMLAGCGCTHVDSFGCGASHGSYIVTDDNGGYGCRCKCHEEP